MYRKGGWELQMAQATPPLARRWGLPSGMGVRLAPGKVHTAGRAWTGGPPPEQV